MNTRALRLTLWLLLALTGAALAAGSAPPSPDAVQAGEVESPASAPTAAAPPASQPAASQPLVTVAPSLLPSVPAGAKVAVIRIEGMIYGFTLENLKRRVERARALNADVIVIELHTPGGMLDVALDIAREIKSLGLPTVAWVNRQAFSAGALIASSCDVIVMSPAAVIGDSAPVQLLQNMAPTERAKILSPLLAEYRDNAFRSGVDYTLFHAMCELGIEVYRIRNPETGEVRLVNQADYEILVRGRPEDEVRARSRAGATVTVPAAQPLPIPLSQGGAGTQPAATVTDIQIGAMPEETIADADVGRWVLVRQVHDGRSLLTLNQNEAADLGLSKGVVGSEADLQKMLGAAGVFSVRQTWSHGMAYWLTQPAIRGLLLALMLFCAYLEFQSPGFGIFGAIAVAALILLIAAPFMAGLAEIWHLVLFVLGVGLLVFELLTPGFGVAGVTGIILILTSLVLAAVPTQGSGPMPLPAPEMMGRLLESLVWMVVALIASVAGMAALTRYFGRLPLPEGMILRNPEPGPVLAGTEGLLVHTSGDDALGEGRVGVGATGRSVTSLRPSGRAAFDGRVVDVVAAGGYIETDRPVRVVEVAGNRIVVEAV